MINQIIEVPDISIVKTIDGTKQLLSLREQKIKKDTLQNFGAGSGVKYQDNLYVLDKPGDTSENPVADITDGLIFYVPFTDGTAREVISGQYPSSGYTKEGGEHLFTLGGKYNINWAVPIGKGTFSIMYRFVSKGSTRAFAFGYDNFYTNYQWMNSYGNGMGIWSNVANGGSLSGGNRQWPRGASSEVSGMWTDDYHVATFTYDFSKATPHSNPAWVGTYEDYTSPRSAFVIYKDGVNVTSTGYNPMVIGDGKALSYVTIGGTSENSAPDEYTTLYVKDARIYNRCLSPEEVKQLTAFCLAKRKA